MNDTVVYCNSSVNGNHVEVAVKYMEDSAIESKPCDVRQLVERALEIIPEPLWLTRIGVVAGQTHVGSSSVPG